jgi:O-antigen/teichoic acid export membrane protein
MSVIAKQSGLASIALGIGLLLGAVNTMYVLPRAFEGHEAVWGLLRIMTSWGLICSSVATLGAPAAIVRFLSRYPEADRGKHLKAILLIAGTGIGLCLIIISIWGGDWIGNMDAKNTDLLKNHVGGFIMIIAIMSLMAIFRALLTLQLKTGIIAWVDEIWQKGSYLVLGGALLLGYLPLESFVPAYIISWFVSLLLLLLPTVKSWPSFNDPVPWSEMRPLADFSLFSLLAGGASIIANQLDYVMIGLYLGLEEVPVYTMGFFIGSVVGMPMRATQKIVSGIVAVKIHSSSAAEMQKLSQNTARVNVLLMASILAGIWAGFEPFQLLLPEKFRGLEVVFICIALSKVVVGLNVSNNSHLGYSEHYRLILPVNLGLVLFTVASNYAFLVVFEMGIAGAALATLCTVLWNNLWRLMIVWRKFKVQPFTWPILPITLIAMTSAWCFHWEAGALGAPPLIEAIALGALGAGSSFSLCYLLGFFPELREAIKHRLPWWP